MGNRLYIGNLSFGATTESLRAAFEAHGSVTDAHVIMDRDSGQSRGFGFVTMDTADSAAKAIKGMNGALVDGRGGQQAEVLGDRMTAAANAGVVPASAAPTTDRSHGKSERSEA